VTLLAELGEILESICNTLAIRNVKALELRYLVN
jgi:hypothetical protein